MKAVDRSYAWMILGTFLSLFVTYPRAGAQSNATQIVLRGARLIDGIGQQAIENSVLVIEGDHIVASGKAATVSILKDADMKDVSGKTIMPALINLHGHLGLSANGADSVAGHYTQENVLKQLNKYLSYGVASVASLGQDEDEIYKIRDAQRTGALGGARLYTAGRGFLEYTGKVNPADHRYRPQTPEEARADVRELAAHHPDFMKMWVDDGLGHGVKLKPEIYQAIIDEAHQQHIRVFAHEFYLVDAKALLAAGIDGFAHSIRDQSVDSDVMQTMKARGVFLIPTLVRDEVLFAYTDNVKWLDNPFFQAEFEPAAMASARSPENIEKPAMIRISPSTGQDSKWARKI
jgi:imidazolonepropionase-like amidohydrolase